MRNQTFGNWEHVVVVAGPGNPALERWLAKASRDPRITPVRQHTGVDPIELANAGLGSASGTWVALLAETDWITPDALASVASEIQADPDAVLVYSDWSQVDPHNQVTTTFRKPDWSPERLRGHEYASDLTVMRTAEVTRLGGFHRCGGVEIHDLLLRLTENGGAVRHVPRALYGRDAARDVPLSDAQWDATVEVVQQHCDRIGLPAKVARGRERSTTRLDRSPRAPHEVSIIIPTRGTQTEAFGSQRTLIVEAVRSMLASSPEVKAEFVVVADEPTSLPYLQELEDLLGPRLVVVPYDKPFNFSEKCNLGAIHASGDILVFANDDLEIISPRWLEQLVALAEDPQVGLVGAFLKFEDGSVQHSGHVYARGIPVHAHFGAPAEAGYFNDLVVDHEASGATAALVACRAEIWDQVGGFCAQLPGSFNDVDFCLKIRSLGHRIVIAMGVESWHFESKSRDPTVEEWEIDFLQSRWNSTIVAEPYMRGSEAQTTA